MRIGKIIGWSVSLVLIGLMGLIAELTGIRELIFPETAALLTGSFLVTQRPWNVSHGIYTLEMSICAFAGVLISRNIDLHLYYKLFLAVLFVCVLLLVSRTSMLPAISACALPVMIGTRDYIYVVAVIIISGICDMGNGIMERTSLMKEKPYVHVKQDVGHWFRLLLLFAALLLLPVLTGLKYMVAPPLIVAYVSLSVPESRKRNPLFLTAFLFTGAALTGFCCRVLSDKTNLPEVIYIIIAAAGAWILFSLTHRFFPPAAAIAVLPFLLPSEGLWKYPLEILAGIILLYAAAWVVSVLDQKLSMAD